MMNDENSFEEISSSEEETIVLDEQFSELLHKLEKDLERLRDDITEDFSDHFNELEELKKTAISSVIDIKKVTWFLETAIFALMIELPEVFSFKPLTFYECMLKSVGSFPENVVRKHLQVLLDKKNEENEDLLLSINKKKKEKNKLSSLLKEENVNEQQISIIRPFFSLLSAVKAQKRASYSENDIVSPKRGKRLRKISPLALPNNRLSNQVDDECHEHLLRHGMKLT